MSSEEDSQWSVVLLNDEFTPMEFVVHVIEQFFDMDYESATRLMLRIHHEGRAECGVYPQAIAEVRANAVMDIARKYRHPLQCVVERKA